MKNLGQMMKQAQQMQSKMAEMQAALEQTEVTGQAGGGMVSITLTGKMETRKVRIDPSLLADGEMLEDLITAAFNDAVIKANAESETRMSAATAGMPIPKGMKIPGLF